MRGQTLVRDVSQGGLQAVDVVLIIALVAKQDAAFIVRTPTHGAAVGDQNKRAAAQCQLYHWHHDRMKARDWRFWASAACHQLLQADDPATWEASKKMQLYE